MAGFRRGNEAGGKSRSSFFHFSTMRCSTITSLVFRILQFIAALAVIGIYAQDLNRANRLGKYSDSKWVYAVTVGSLAAVTAAAFSLATVFVQYRAVALLFAWDWVMVILWAAVTGIFGSMYLGEHTEMESGIHRMKVGVGFDITSLILFFLTALIGTVFFFTERGSSWHMTRSKA